MTWTRPHARRRDGLSPTRLSWLRRDPTRRDATVFAINNLNTAAARRHYASRMRAGVRWRIVFPSPGVANGHFRRSVVESLRERRGKGAGDERVAEGMRAVHVGHGRHVGLGRRRGHREHLGREILTLLTHRTCNTDTGVSTATGV